MGDIDYQKVVDDLDRQDFNVMEDKIEELLGWPTNTAAN